MASEAVSDAPIPLKEELAGLTASRLALQLPPGVMRQVYAEADAMGMPLSDYCTLKLHKAPAIPPTAPATQPQEAAERSCPPRDEPLVALAYPGTSRERIALIGRKGMSVEDVTEAARTAIHEKYLKLVGPRLATQPTEDEAGTLAVLPLSSVVAHHTMSLQRHRRRSSRQ